MLYDSVCAFALDLLPELSVTLILSPILTFADALAAFRFTALFAGRTAGRTLDSVVSLGFVGHEGLHEARGH